jgi:hypothetical protein
VLSRASLAEPPALVNLGVAATILGCGDPIRPAGFGQAEFMQAKKALGYER